MAETTLTHAHDVVHIRPLAGSAEVAALERHLASVPRGRHRERYAGQQRGFVTYLVAWVGATPVGHLLIRWEGSSHEAIAAVLADCPELEDFFVVPEARGRRIGLALLREAEAEALARGYRHVGLAVGLTPEYARARALYARLGYRNAGFSPYYEGWWTHDAHGEPSWWEEAAEYLTKTLDLQAE